MSSNRRDREQYRSECRGCDGQGETKNGLCSICRGKGVVEYKNPEKDATVGGSRSSRIPNDDSDKLGDVRPERTGRLHHS